MKVKVETPPICAAVICQQNDCPWRKVCANHESAGDFRTEGGYRPILRLEQGEVFCDSFDMKGQGFEYNDQPAIQGTHPYAVQGCCDYMCVLWSELVEETDTYEI